MLNIGVGGNMANWHGPDYVHVDVDRWDYSNFVQGDAHHLPFKDNSFASVALGDVLEHLVYPVLALQEASRIAPKIVMTTFQEWRLGGVGCSIEAGYKLYGSAGPYPGRISTMPESVISHNPHIWQWSPDLLQSIIDRSGLEVIHYETDSPGIHEGHTMLNYLFVLNRKE